ILFSVTLSTSWTSHSSTPTTSLFFSAASTTGLYTLSLHDALPIWIRPSRGADAEHVPGGVVRRRVRLVSAEMRKGIGACVRLVRDRKSTRLNSSHGSISYAVFCL